MSGVQCNKAARIQNKHYTVNIAVTSTTTGLTHNGHINTNEAAENDYAVKWCDMFLLIYFYRLYHDFILLF